MENFINPVSEKPKTNYLNIFLISLAFILFISGVYYLGRYLKRLSIPSVVELPIVINEEAKSGCRAPDEPGCLECVEKHNNKCSISAWHGFPTDSLPTSESWYNSSRVSSCDIDLPKCAICSRGSEKLLLALLSNDKLKKCNCNSVDIGIDPCFSPNSCECLCSVYKGTSKSCPFVKI